MMCPGIKKIVFANLVAIAPVFPASGQYGSYIYHANEFENSFSFSVIQIQYEYQLLDLFSGISVNLPELHVEAWWEFTLITFVVLLFLLVLWFYRRYEIRRLKHLNTMRNQYSDSGVTSENDNLNDLLHWKRKEWIDQCLTGFCDKRFCFFYTDGNVIYVEDHIKPGSEPASVEMLLKKVNAEKFCEHLCRDRGNKKLPAWKFVNKEIINGINNLSEFQSYKKWIKPYSHSKELNHSADLFAFDAFNSHNYLRDLAITPNDKEFILNAIKIIEANYTDYRFSAEQLAKKSNMSVSQFNRKLKTLTGFPAGRFISKFRLYHASEFLIHRTDSISDICFSAGYNGLAYFSRAFKREYGCTPSVYRQLMTKKSISVRK